MTGLDSYSRRVSTAGAFRKMSSIYVLSYFPFGFDRRMLDLIVSVPDHCLFFTFDLYQSLNRLPI